MNSAYYTAESNFKSSVQNKINELQQNLSSMAETGKTHNEFAAEEAAFLQEVEKTKDAANKQCDNIKNEILKKRPTPNAPQSERNAYNELLGLSAQGMKTLQTWLNSIFGRIFDIVRNIVQWVWTGIVNVASRIATAFSTIFNLFF